MKCKTSWCKNKAYDGSYCLNCEDNIYEAQCLAAEDKAERDEYGD